MTDVDPRADLPDELAARTPTEPPAPADGYDPWCTWCDADLDGEVWMLHGECSGRWPPAFDSEECAEAWGNATHEGDAFRVADDGLPVDPEEFRLDEQGGPCPYCGSFDVDFDRKFAEPVVIATCDGCGRCDVLLDRAYESVEADFRESLREKREGDDAG